MTSVTGEVVERRADVVVVHVDALSCAGCRQACQSAGRIELPFVAPSGGRVEIEMSARNQCLTAMNALGLPLAGFVAGAVLADVFFGNDIGALAGSLVGFVAGFLACRTRTFDTVVIREAVDP